MKQVFKDLQSLMMGVSLGLCVVSSLMAEDAASHHPKWWSESGTSIGSAGSGPGVTENHAPINIGQLKAVATQARKYLDEKLALVGGAGTEIKNLVDSWPTTNNPENFAVANVGQLKNVASTFYRRLDAVGYPVVSRLLEVGFPKDVLDAQTRPIYPWAMPSTGAENQAPATVGQLKMVFSFDLTHQQWVTRDADDDEVPDFVEVIGGSDSSSFDTDLDGVSDLAEYLMGTDPRSLPTASGGYTSTGRVKLVVFSPSL